MHFRAMVIVLAEAVAGAVIRGVFGKWSVCVIAIGLKLALPEPRKVMPTTTACFSTRTHTQPGCRASATLECLRVDKFEDAFEGVVRRNAVWAAARQSS